MTDLKRILIADVLDANTFIETSQRRMQRETDQRDELIRVAMANGVSARELADALRRPVDEVKAWAARAAASDWER